jgi:hypothetical protein
MSTTKSFVDLMRDPSFIEQQRATREREAREQHERRVRRGSHEPGDVKPSAADIRASITKDRAFSFDHEIERQRRGRDRNGSKGAISKVMSALLPKGEGNNGR